MSCYKLELVKQVLRVRYGAEQVSVGARPRTEVWRRVVAGHDHRVYLTWEHGEEVVPEIDVRYAAEGLAIDADSLIEAIRAIGGLWLGPTPPRSR